MRLPADATLIVADMREPAVETTLADVKPRSNAAALVAAWRQEELPLVRVRPDPKGSGLTGAPSEIAIAGRRADAFQGAELERLLDDIGATTLVLCGVWSDASLAATARHAGELGYHVFIVADACQSADGPTSLAGLGDEGARIADTAEALGAAATAKFRQRRDAARRR
jgi:hypothetical protein